MLSERHWGGNGLWGAKEGGGSSKGMLCTSNKERYGYTRALFPKTSVCENRFAHVLIIDNYEYPAIASEVWLKTVQAHTLEKSQR